MSGRQGSARLRGEEATASTATKQPREKLLSPLALPCGLVVPNRLVKASLYEHLSPLYGGPPNERHITLYSKWGKGEWGMVMTGNIQVKADHLSLGRDIVVPEELNTANCAPFTQLANAIHGSSADGHKNTTLAIMQLSHAGRQSTNIVGGRAIGVPPLAPSAVPLELKHGKTSEPSRVTSLFSTLLFTPPQEMTHHDIDVVVEAFVRGAKLAAMAGFDGIELHAGHGYLLTQFISPKSNVRTDEYSAIKDPLCFIRRIATAIRAPGVVPKAFAVGIKLNAADYVDRSSVVTDDSSDELRVLGHIREIGSWGMIDFIEVSGGNYEDPEFITHSSRSSNRRQAFFSKFSQRALAELSSSPTASQRPLVLLTGGFTEPELMQSALSNGHGDLLGIGRLSISSPLFPRSLKELEQKAMPAEQRKQGTTASTSTVEHILEGLLVWLWTSIPEHLRPQFPNLIGAGVEVAAYTVGIHELSESPNTEPVAQEMPNPQIAHIVRMWLYMAPGPSSAWPSWLVVSLSAVVVAVAFALF